MVGITAVLDYLSLRVVRVLNLLSQSDRVVNGYPQSTPINPLVDRTKHYIDTRPKKKHNVKRSSDHRPLPSGAFSRYLTAHHERRWDLRVSWRDSSPIAFSFIR